MTRWARVARGTVAALASLFIAAFFHSLAGGGLPGIAGISLCVTFSVIACTALAGRRMPRTRLAASVVASQAMYHWLFGSLGSVSVATASPLGHAHHAPIDFGPLATHVHSHGDMYLAHLAAAILTFIILAFGERSIAAVVHAAREFILSVIPRVPDIATPPLSSHVAPPRMPLPLPQSLRVDHSGLRHRGPPTLSAA